MRINNFLYLLKEGIRGIFTHGFMSFAAVCVTVACLVIVGSFSLLTYNVSIMVEELNQTNEIMVYVDETYSDAEAKSIGTTINMLDNVLQSTYVSREEALQNFIEDHENDPAFGGVTASDLRHRFVVVLEDNRLMKQTDEAIQNIPVLPRPMPNTSWQRASPPFRTCFALCPLRSLRCCWWFPF